MLESEQMVEDEELWEDDGSDDYLGLVLRPHGSVPVPGARAARSSRCT